MKKILLLCVVSAFFVAGCASKGGEIPPSNLGQVNACLSGAPDWVINGGAEGGLSSAGAAKIGKAGLNFARTEALANGRDEIARQLQVKVNNMFKNFVQATGVGDDESVDRLAANVSKQVSSQMISGSKQGGSWVSPCNDLYVLVVVDPSLAVKNVKDQALSSYQKEAALWQQFQAKKAQDELDAAVQKEFGAQSTPVAPVAPVAPAN